VNSNCSSDHTDDREQTSEMSDQSSEQLSLHSKEY
jgi:hypothetical protein